MWKSATGYLLASVAVIAANPALAEDESILDPINVEVEKENPGDLEISEQQLEELQPSTLGQVFDGQTAVTGANALPSAQKVFVHGIEESQLNVTIDGARTNKGSFHHAGNVLIDPFLLRSVTVSPGVATADAGPQALAGAIRYETLDARDLLAAGQNFGARFRLNYADNGDTFYGSSTFYGRSGGFEYLLSYSGAQGDDYEDGDGDIVQGSAAALDSYVAKAAYTTATGKRFEFSADYTVDEGPRQTRPNFGGVIGMPTVLDTVKVDRTGYILSYVDESPEGWLAPEVTLAWGEQGFENFERSGTTTTFNGKFQNRFLLGNGTLIAGVDFFDDKAEGGDFGNQFAEKLRNVGLFAQAEQSLTDALTISYGGRYDYQWFTGSDGSKFDAGGLSGNVTLDYALTNGLTLTAGLSSVFGGYALGEAAVINARGTTWTYAGMDTSRSNNARVGMSYTSGGFDAGAALFYTEIDGAQVVNSFDRSVAADIESKGVDATIGYTYGKGAIRLNYTYADVTQDGGTPGTTNDYLSTPVGHLFGLQAVHQLSDEWRVGGTAEIALDNDETVGVIGGRGTTMYELPGYEAVNLFAVYEPKSVGNLSIRGEIRNLFDQTYMKRTANGAGQDDLIVPLYEPGRTFVLSATFLF